MICQICGANLSEGSRFCTKCGNQIAQQAPTPPPAYEQPPVYQQAPTPPPAYEQPPVYQQAPVNAYQEPQYNAYGAAPVSGENPRSKFDANALESFCAFFVAGLIITLTCGIGTPWAMSYLLHFICRHAVVDGKRMVFDGNGGQLFGNYIKWFLLTVITCGIYGFWVIPKMISWIVKHIHIVEE